MFSEAHRLCAAPRDAHLVRERPGRLHIGNAAWPGVVVSHAHVRDRAPARVRSAHDRRCATARETACPCATSAVTARSSRHAPNRRMSRMAKGSELVDALDRYFTRYASTLELTDELIQAKRAPQELLLLLVGRLDSLASVAAKEDAPAKERFVNLVTTFGTHKDVMQRVSAGDLFYELGYHRWLLEGMIEAPGRIKRFSPLDDAFIDFIWQSGIPITLDDATKLTSRAIAGVEESFGVRPKQPRVKPTSGTPDQLVQAVVAKHKAKQFKDVRDALPAAVRALVRNARLAEILYVRFRSGVVHELSVQMNEERFFTETAPYWEPWASEYYGGFLHVEFPAQFLLDMLKAAMNGYRQMLIAKGTLPMGILFTVFDENVLDNL